MKKGFKFWIRLWKNICAEEILTHAIAHQKKIEKTCGAESIMMLHDLLTQIKYEIELMKQGRFHG